jgi:hypothetical protein
VRGAFALGGWYGLPVRVVLGSCRVAAFGLDGLRDLAILFITISHCAWRHVISVQSDKETKQRKRFPTTDELVSLACRPQFLAPDSTVLARLAEV